MSIFNRIADAIISRAERRMPDFIIGGHEDPYLLRWWLIPRNRIFNVYLHKFLRSDDDRALHDHPWCWCSILLRGSYLELTDLENRRPGETGWRVKRLSRGSIRFHRAVFAHRLVLEPAAATCWTLFITGPRVRDWGFHCPQGWVPWRQFTAADDPGAVGKGCSQ